MKSIFSRIIAGEIPSHKIAEDESHYAFLDAFPLSKGHTLVIPKKEIDYIFDLGEEEYLALHTFARKIAKAIDSAVTCKRVGTCVIGLEVPHVHIHLVPLHDGNTLNFSNPKLSFSAEELSSIAKEISSKL